MLSLWNPFSELMRFGETADRWPFGQYPQRFSPAVDVREEKDAIVIQAELPGVQPDDVNVSVEGNLLTISGERGFSREQTEQGYRRIERSYGSFSRSFTLPDTVAIDRLDAEMKDGVLTLTLPKSQKAEPKRIAVKSGTKPTSEVGAEKQPVLSQAPQRTATQPKAGPSYDQQQTRG